ncbi:MAG: 3-dehydroquinate synthase [Gammaproteobacteria bacterium]|nr:3-dehydroquinate synthase [Gammaproteobacteria bacterium]
MNQVKVNIPQEATRSYPILIAGGLLTEPQRWLPTTVAHCVVISDDTVNGYYGKILLQALKQQGITPLQLTFAAGEGSKSYAVKQQLEAQMFEHGCDRDTLILALGGGVTGDLAGFIAATYMRGIAYIQLPTSLLAMVDSSVGGKTGINNDYGKNLIGAFLQPQAVVSDIHCLRTLPQAHRITGLVEAAKMFISNDKESFALVQQQDKTALLSDEALLVQIITRAVSIKAGIVERDQKERNSERAVCNFGHTIAHAIERISDYQLLHGDAVALGILVEIRIAQLLGVLTEEVCLVIESFLSRLGFAGSQLAPFTVEEVVAATRLDKKAKAGRVYYVLLQQIGQMLTQQGKFTHLVDDEIVTEAFLKVSRGEFDGR